MTVSLSDVVGAADSNCTSFDDAKVVEELPEVALNVSGQTVLNMLAVSVLAGWRDALLITFVRL